MCAQSMLSCNRGMGGEKWYICSLDIFVSGVVVCTQHNGALYVINIMDFFWAKN